MLPYRIAVPNAEIKKAHLRYQGGKDLPCGIPQSGSRKAEIPQSE